MNFPAFVPIAALGAALAAAPGVAQTVQPYEVTVTLTDKARARLREAGEGIIVSATYSGRPNPTATSAANEIGMIDLGDASVALPATAGAAVFEGAAIDTARVAMIDGGILANINVYSARLSSEDNLLACDFFDGAIDTLSGTSIELTCSLITEARQPIYRH